MQLLKGITGTSVRSSRAFWRTEDHEGGCWTAGWPPEVTAYRSKLKQNLSPCAGFTCRKTDVQQLLFSARYSRTAVFGGQANASFLQSVVSVGSKQRLFQGPVNTPAGVYKASGS